MVVVIVTIQLFIVVLLLYNYLYAEIFTSFCHTMLCISAAYAVMQCLSVCLSRS